MTGHDDFLLIIIFFNWLYMIYILTSGQFGQKSVLFHCQQKPPFTHHSSDLQKTQNTDLNCPPRWSNCISAGRSTLSRDLRGLCFRTLGTLCSRAAPLCGMWGNAPAFRLEGEEGGCWEISNHDFASSDDATMRSAGARASRTLKADPGTVHWYSGPN